MPVMNDETPKRTCGIGVQQVNIIGGALPFCLPSTEDVGCQASFPVLGVHTIRDNNQKTRFYTGFKNWGTFWLLFPTLVSQHGAEKLKYWESTRKYVNPQLKKPGKRRSLALEDDFFMVWLRLRHDIVPQGEI